MTAYLFTDWIRTVNRTMRRQRRNILMFLDNASSHSEDVRLSNVTLKFLPPNTTSVLQPLDQGIIRAFKARYRKLMITSLLTKIDNSDSATELCRQISVLDAIHWITRAWNDTKDTTIVKCFNLAGFTTPNPDDDNAGEDDDDDVPLQQLARELRLSNADPCFDDHLPTEDDSDDWEKDLIASHKPQPDAEDSDDDDDILQPETTPEEQLSLEDTLAAVKKIHHTTTVSSILQKTQTIITDLEQLLVQKRLHKKQTTMDSFLCQ